MVPGECDRKTLSVAVVLLCSSYFVQFFVTLCCVFFQSQDPSMFWLKRQARCALIQHTTCFHMVVVDATVKHRGFSGGHPTVDRMRTFCRVRQGTCLHDVHRHTTFESSRFCLILGFQVFIFSSVSCLNVVRPRRRSIVHLCSRECRDVIVSGACLARNHLSRANVS